MRGALIRKRDLPAFGKLGLGRAFHQHLHAFFQSRDPRRLIRNHIRQVFDLAGKMRDPFFMFKCLGHIPALRDRT